MPLWVCKRVRGASTFLVCQTPLYEMFVRLRMIDSARVGGVKSPPIKPEAWSGVRLTDAEIFPNDGSNSAVLFTQVAENAWFSWLNIIKIGIVEGFRLMEALQVKGFWAAIFEIWKLQQCSLFVEAIPKILKPIPRLVLSKLKIFVNFKFYAIDCLIVMVLWC